MGRLERGGVAGDDGVEDLDSGVGERPRLWEERGGVAISIEVASSVVVAVAVAGGGALVLSERRTSKANALVVEARSDGDGRVLGALGLA